MDVDPRFEHTHRALPLGTLCHTEFRDTTQTYVFGGWARNTAGLYPVFYRVHQREFVSAGWLVDGIWTYTAAVTSTILGKFPDLPEECR